MPTPSAWVTIHRHTLHATRHTLCSAPSFPPRFALRARNIKNDPKVHDDPGDGVVKQYKEQAEKLHAEYKDKIAKMEAEHADEVLLLREELKAIQVRVEEPTSVLPW